MTSPRILMLVSARVDSALRAEVVAGQRPRPEYLVLEERYGVTLLDWSHLKRAEPRRSPRQSLRHIAAALPQLRAFDVVFTDGEHLGLPLALAMRSLRIAIPHVMLGHHLTTPTKRRLLRLLRPETAIDRILLHSRHQLERVAGTLAVPRSRLAFVPYGVDTSFWHPVPEVEEPLIVSAGREHRDYLTLARACAAIPERVFIAAGSRFSAGAHCLEPAVLPAQFESRFADYESLRQWYARARLVVLPLIPNDFQAGVTTLLEAMAMGKAIVVSGTEGQRDMIDDGVTGVVVRPQDAGELRRAIRSLMAGADERARLGSAARQVVHDRYDVERYADSLASHLQEVAGARAAAA